MITTVKHRQHPIDIVAIFRGAHCALTNRHKRVPTHIKPPIRAATSMCMCLFSQNSLELELCGGTKAKNIRTIFTATRTYYFVYYYLQLLLLVTVVRSIKRDSFRVASKRTETWHLSVPSQNAQCLLGRLLNFHTRFGFLLQITLKPRGFFRAEQTP